MATSAVPIGGVVLCGGRSRRMGTSKAWLTGGGEYLLQRMVRIVAGVVHPVVVAARPQQSLPRLSDDVLLAYDAVENGGPLAGMAAAFELLAGRCEAAFVVSCDQPLLKPSFITRLIDLLDNHAAVVPRHEDRLHSLTAVYRLDTRKILTRLLTQDDLRVERLVETCRARIVPASQLIDADPGLESLYNVNDPRAYQHIRKTLRD